MRKEGDIHCWKSTRRDPLMTFGSAYLDGKHGDRTAIDPLYRETDPLIFFAKTEHIEQRQVVVRRRDREQRVTAELFVSDDLFVPAFEQQLSHAVLKSHS